MARNIHEDYIVCQGLSCWKKLRNQKAKNKNNTGSVEKFNILQNALLEKSEFVCST